MLDGTPIDEGLARSLRGGFFLTGQRNIALVGGAGIGETRRASASASTADAVRTGARDRYFDTVDLVNRLEEESRLGKAGMLAVQPSRLWPNYSRSRDRPRAARLHGSRPRSSAKPV